MRLTPKYDPAREEQQEINSPDTRGRALGSDESDDHGDSEDGQPATGRRVHRHGPSEDDSV